MSFFKKIFGKKTKLTEPQSVSSAIQPDYRKDPNYVQVFDEYGKELFITKNDWRKMVLDNIKLNWDSPDKLYGIILDALDNEFFSDILKAAEHLYKIDTIPVRGTCIYGIVLMKNNELKKAENILLSYIKKYGEDGVILTNLAKVYSYYKNKDELVEKTLYHALEIDPNQDNGLLWYEVMKREQGGDEAGLEAFKTISKIPGSWRPQLWLARHELEIKNIQKAKDFYNICLSRVEKPVPSDLLKQMSGDLGNNSYINELLELTAPYFDVEFHGLQVGNNLIKAYLTAGKTDDAYKILNALYSQKRRDWQETLSYWDTEIAKARLKPAENISKPLKMRLCTIQGPIWYKQNDLFSKLFPDNKDSNILISFLGSTAEMPIKSNEIQHTLTNQEGRMSRALPLFLAEQINQFLNINVKTIIPCIEEGGFILCGVPWTNDDGINYSTFKGTKSDYVIITHLKTINNPWVIELRFIRCIDKKLLGNITKNLSFQNLEKNILSLVKELLNLVQKNTDLIIGNPSSLYKIPSGSNFGNYLLRLEQLLAVKTTVPQSVNLCGLSNEREIIDGNIRLCLDCPDNVITRILLAQTLISMKKARPDILPEFKEKIILLQNEKPLTDITHPIVNKMMSEALND